MEVGNIVHIRSSAGHVEVELVEKLNVRNLATIGLGTMTNCRWEFHKQDENGSSMVLSTIYNDTGKDNKVIYIADLTPFIDEEIDVFEGRIVKSEHENTRLHFKTIYE